MKLKRLLQSPFTLHTGILGRIERETRIAAAGRPARIIAKMNALNEPQVVRALYAASQAGVQIDLIIRGACTLRPGVPGISDNIRVRSIVGRFLEHSRVYWFGNDGAPEMYCASADWLERNLLRRVETCFPILDPELAKRVYREVLQNYLDDNLNAWELDADGIYHKRAPAHESASHASPPPPRPRSTSSAPPLSGVLIEARRKRALRARTAGSAVDLAKIQRRGP
jgi:polyphosphate kinase